MQLETFKFKKVDDWFKYVSNERYIASPSVLKNSKEKDLQIFYEKFFSADFEKASEEKDFPYHYQGLSCPHMSYGEYDNGDIGPCTVGDSPYRQFRWIYRFHQDGNLVFFHDHTTRLFISLSATYSAIPLIQFDESIY